MAIPVEVVQRTVTYGPETDFQGNAVTGTLTFVPSEDIMWVASGQGFHVKPISVSLNSSGSGSVDLICTDQPGFRNATGSTITGWFYSATADLAGVPSSTRKFQVPSGAGSLDLDTMIPVTGNTGITVNVPAIINLAGLTGPTITANQLTTAIGSNLVATTTDQSVAGVKTFTDSIEFPTQVARTGQIIMHSVNDPGGFIQKNIVFKMDGTLSRPGPVWYDQNDRLQVWTGWHDTIPGGSSHHGWEIKSATDPAGSFPTVLATRFRIKSDADQTQAAFYNCEMVYIENGIASAGTQFGVTFNTPTVGSVVAGTATGGNYKAGKVTVAVESDGVATMHLAAGLDNTNGAKVAFFRDTAQTSGAVNINVYKGDGTNAITFSIDAKTGNVTASGQLTLGPGATVFRGSLDGSNHVTFDVDTVTVDGSRNAYVRMFRNVTTSGQRRLRLSKGDGTNTDTVVLDAAAGTLSGLGADGVTLKKAVLEDDSRIVNPTALQRSSDASTMGRLFGQGNLNLTSGSLYTVRATPVVSGTFTKIRFATSSTAPAGLTDVRAGVFDAAGTVQQQTANISAAVTGANIVVEQALASAATVVAGTDVFLGLSFIGTTLQVKGAAVVAAMAGLTPVLSRTGSWAGGVALGNATGSATGNLIWIELVP